MSSRAFRSLSSNNDYSLGAIERDILIPNNLRFVRDSSGEIADVTNPREGVEGSLAIEAIEPEAMTPKLAKLALDGAERAEREYLKTGQRNLYPHVEKPSADNLDFERAVIIANLLDGPSLELLAARGMHGGKAGNRMAKVDAVASLLHKGSYGYDPYTGAPILGTSQDQGHLESNSRGGVRLRPESSIINQYLTDTEGAARQKQIDRTRGYMNVIEQYPKVIADVDIQRLVPGASLAKAASRAKHFGYEQPDYVPMKRDAGDAMRLLAGGSTRLDSPGTNRERALVIDSGGGDVNIGEGVLRTNGKNGNGNGKH